MAVENPRKVYPLSPDDELSQELGLNYDQLASDKKKHHHQRITQAKANGRALFRTDGNIIFPGIIHLGQELDGQPFIEDGIISPNKISEIVYSVPVTALDQNGRFEFIRTALFARNDEQKRFRVEVSSQFQEPIDIDELLHVFFEEYAFAALENKDYQEAIPILFMTSKRFPEGFIQNEAAKEKIKQIFVNPDASEKEKTKNNNILFEIRQLIEELREEDKKTGKYSKKDTKAKTLAFTSTKVQAERLRVFTDATEPVIRTPDTTTLTTEDI